uniref:ZP domain-containing protein n=1 Tax=Ciona savignyi TaxID=51511 RepID=H2ZBP8_CIOSA
MYNDSTFANALSNNQTQSLTFVVPQFIYFAMVSNADPTQYIMQATDCWVTETNDASAAIKYDIISAGCAVADSVYIDANKVFMNYQSSQVRIGFRSFVWSTGGVSLFVHCTINMCDLRLPNNCTAAPSCASVGRRSITSDTPKNIWSYGPIFVKGPPTACDTFNGGCSHHCIPLGDGKVECSCPVNYVINTDGQTCRDLLLDPVVGDAKIRAGLGKIVELSDSMDISTLATTVLLGVVFLVAIVVAIYVIGQARNRAWLSGTPHLTL